MTLSWPPKLIVYIERYECSQSNVSDGSKEYELMDVPHEVYERIEKYITSDESPVGIDAKKTHILILHKLMEIERKLDNLSQTVTNKTS